MSAQNLGRSSTCLGISVSKHGGFSTEDYDMTFTSDILFSNPVRFSDGLSCQIQQWHISLSKSET